MQDRHPSVSLQAVIKAKRAKEAHERLLRREEAERWRESRARWLSGETTAAGESRVAADRMPYANARPLQAPPLPVKPAPVTPKERPRQKGGRPAEYDWDVMRVMCHEILFEENLPLPGDATAFIKKLQKQYRRRFKTAPKVVTMRPYVRIWLKDYDRSLPPKARK
jgi:hypothetical protein